MNRRAQEHIGTGQAHPLDRPVWTMLNGRQAHLAVARGAAVRIDPAYGPFAAARDQSDAAQAALAAVLAGPEDAVAIVEADHWPAPPGTQVIQTGDLVQMVAEVAVPMCAGDADCRLLGEADVAAMTALALATEPGPWAPATHRYGDFFGLFREGRLVAMAGQRMLPHQGFAEVSAVCTDPAFRGQGLAGMLIRRVMAGMRARGEVPFLHSYAHNAGAIALYDSLGFRVRREMQLTIIARQPTDGT